MRKFEGGYAPPIRTKFGLPGDRAQLREPPSRSHAHPGDERQFAAELIIHAQCCGVAGLSELDQQREWQSRWVKTDQGMITPSGSLASTYPSGFMVFS